MLDLAPKRFTVFACSMLLTMLPASIWSIAAPTHLQATAVTVPGKENSASPLTPSQLESLLPATVFFRGKTTTVQLRNAGGVRFGATGYFLAVMVDTGGYASDVQESYQFYLITESAVLIADQRLAPGAYGAGFVNGKLIVMDLGGHQVLHGETTLEGTMTRPRPLQVVADGGDAVRLYLGRRWVRVAPDGTS